MSNQQQPKDGCEVYAACGTAIIIGAFIWGLPGVVMMVVLSGIVIALTKAGKL